MRSACRRTKIQCETSHPTKLQTNRSRRTITRDRLAQRQRASWGLLACLSEKQRKRFLKVVESARAGADYAKNALCEILETELPRRIDQALNKKGVSWSECEAARHDVIILAQAKVLQLRFVKKVSGWLYRIIAQVAKAYRPRSAKVLNVKGTMRLRSKRPKQIGRKYIVVDGRLRIVKVFAPQVAADQPPWRQPLFEPLSDSVVLNSGETFIPDYARNIDRQKTLTELGQSRANKPESEPAAIRE